MGPRRTYCGGVGLEHRLDYDWGELIEADAGTDPVALLERWLADAEANDVPEFNAMAVSTVDDTGRPRSRNVLLRGVDADGSLSFFTNRHSVKGRDLERHHDVCVLFSWLGIHRQVRIQGVARPLGDAADDAYFASRPRESQIGAWASEQSTVIDGREALLARVEEFTERFAGADVPRPPHWGGYAVQPVEFEFWQGRPSRLHDRLRFTSDGSEWCVERLSP